MTTLEGLRVSDIPCAKTLSVAGFLSLPSLFPLGKRVIPGLNYLLFLPGVSQHSVLNLSSSLLSGLISSCATLLSVPGFLGYLRLLPAQEYPMVRNIRR